MGKVQGADYACFGFSGIEANGTFELFWDIIDYRLGSCEHACGKQVSRLPLLCDFILQIHKMSIKCHQ